MQNKNHNIRFNTDKPDENRAWEILHSKEVSGEFKSQNRFVIEAINDLLSYCRMMPCMRRVFGLS
jgi:hypothetical protein